MLIQFGIMALILRSVAMSTDTISDDLKPLGLMRLISYLSAVQGFIVCHTNLDPVYNSTPHVGLITNQVDRASLFLNSNLVGQGVCTMTLAKDMLPL